jgi:hypothetical protein
MLGLSIYHILIDSLKPPHTHTIITTKTNMCIQIKEEIKNSNIIIMSNKSNFKLLSVHFTLFFDFLLKYNYFISVPIKF